jgi:amino acid permease
LSMLESYQKGSKRLYLSTMKTCGWTSLLEWLSTCLSSWVFSMRFQKMSRLPSETAADLEKADGQP